MSAKQIRRRREVLLAGAAATLAAPAVLRAGVAQAQQQGGAGPATPAQAPAQAPGFYRFKVGGFTVTTVNDGYLRRPGVDQSLVRNVDPGQVQAALRESFLPAGHLDIPITVTFIETPRGLVVFDSGTGGQLTPTATGLAANMRAAGLDPARVVLVAVSHFHGDHISGLTSREDAVVFPNAEIAVPAVEWAYWTDEGEAGRAPEGRRPTFANTRRRFAPYQARLRRFEDGAELLPGIHAVAAHGHTPGHCVIHVADGGEQMMALADLTNRPEINLRNPGWHFAGDQEPQTAEVSRRRLLDRVAADRIRCTAYHWPFPANGYMAKEDEGYRLVPAEWSGAL